MAEPSSPPSTPHHDWDAAAYQKLSTPQLEWGLRVIARLSPRPGATVLDAGCGSGRLTMELVGAYPACRVIAVDRSANMVHEASAVLAPYLGPQLALVRADLAALPFAGAADAVFSNAALHWVLDPGRLYASLFTALKPGGRLEAQCGGGPNLARQRARLDVLRASEAFAPYFEDWRAPWRFDDEAAAVMHLRAAGFTGISTSLVAAPTRFENEAAWREFVVHVVIPTYLERLPDAKLRDTLLDALASASRHDDPPWTLDYWRLNLSARKPEA
jgi:SAM-dependent methyltransferase